MSITLSLEEKEEKIHKEADVEGLTTTTSTLHNQIHLLKVNLPFHSTIRTSQKVLGPNVKSVENKDIKHWIAIIGWILPIKVNIHLPN